MGLFKPRGKHAQGAHAQLEAVQQEESRFSLADIGEGVEDSPDVSYEGPSEDAVSLEESIPEIEPADYDMPVPSYEPVAEPAPVADGIGPELSASLNVHSMGGFAPVTSEGIVLRKKRRVGKVLGITFGTIIGILLIAYIAGAIVFMGRFFPNTVIAGQDLSMMPDGEVVELLDRTVDDYAIKVTGAGFSYNASSKDIDLSIDSEGIVSAMHDDLNAWTWPVLLYQSYQAPHDENDLLEVAFNKKSYEAELTQAVTEFNQTAVPPVDATIAYDEQAKKFNVVAEVPGTQYDPNAILAAMADDISALEPNLKLTSEFLVQPNVLSTDERLVNSAEMATGLTSAHITLTMAGQHALDIDGSNLSQFIRIDENMGVTLDEPALNDWVTNVSDGFDTVGTERTYTRPDGKVITVSGGSYGWLTDSLGLKDQVVEAIKAGQTTTIDIPCQQTADVYNGMGQPDWGGRYIDVDISEQYVRFYDNGNIIWETACITGSPDGVHDTGRGVWFVNNKESPSKLVGYENGVKIYETTVSYWMAFESSEIGFHDATWQPGFGGEMYAIGYGSHGCVNLSYGDAQSLFDIIQIDDCVIVHD